MYVFLNKITLTRGYNRYTLHTGKVEINDAERGS